MKTLIIGHRGFNSQYVENTLESFEAALAHGADGIELDVHLSSDGEVMVFHDFDLKRMTGQEGFIFQYTLKELKAMRVGSNHEMPSLSEVLDLLVSHKKQGKKVYLNVEFKAGSQMYEGIEQKVMKLCYQKLSPDEVIFSSFDHQALLDIKVLDARALTGVLTTAALVKPWAYMDTIQGDFYHPYYLTLTPKLLQDMFGRGVKINAYTVNDQRVGQQLMAAGIHMIITDDVASMVALREASDYEA